MTAHTPLRCANSVMAQRTTHEVVLLDTGNYPSYSNFLNETWTWNGTDWTNTSATLIDAKGPLPGRTNMCMANDGTNLMMFGGQGNSATDGLFDDTWIWNGTSWSQSTGPGLSPLTPFGRYGMGASNHGNNQVIIFGGKNNLFMLNETWIWTGTTQIWSQVTVANGTGPNARINHMMAGNVAGLTVVFGGEGTNSQFNDTWTFNGTSWTQKFPTTSPSVRSDAAFSYDVTRAKFVMFGGKNEYNYLNETWLYDSTANTWTQQSPATSPPGLVGAQMCWDSQSGNTLLFGGISATANYPSNQTWSWNGTNWSQLG